MDYIKDKFAVIEDFRHPSYIKYSLVDIFVIIMLAVMCGLDDLDGIETYAQSKKAFLKETFNIKKIPSKATLCRILNAIDADAVAAVIIDIMKNRAAWIKDNIIAVDGKAIRSTSKKGQPHSALQILSAYVTESGVILAQKSIHKKTNEIPVFQEILDDLSVAGNVITADAMHCQKETCRKITDKYGDYVFGLKENQKTLYEDVQYFFEEEFDSKKLDSFSTTEKNGGRIEKRICKKCSDITWINGYEQWSGLKAVFAVKRITQIQDKKSCEMSYYITSKGNATAKELLHICREHWKIESMHWLLDVTFSEDTCRLLSENGHKTLNILRKLALMLHKQHMSKQTKKNSLKKNLLKCLMNDALLCEVLDI